MTSTQTTAFQEALERHAATWSETTAADFESTLREHIREPVVGALLPFEGLSFDGLPVETDPSPGALQRARTGVTPAAIGIADYGTIVLTSGHGGTEQTSLYPERHVGVLRESDILADMPAAFDYLGDAFANRLTGAVLATGPSATADMGALVYGAHGPTTVHVIILTDR